MSTKQETREPTAWRVDKQRQYGKGEQISTIYKYLLELAIELDTIQSHPVFYVISFLTIRTSL